MVVLHRLAILQLIATLCLSPASRAVVQDGEPWTGEYSSGWVYAMDVIDTPPADLPSRTATAVAQTVGTTLGGGPGLRNDDGATRAQLLAGKDRTGAERKFGGGGGDVTRPGRAGLGDFLPTGELGGVEFGDRTRPGIGGLGRMNRGDESVTECLDSTATYSDGGEGDGGDMTFPTTLAEDDDSGRGRFGWGRGSAGGATKKLSLGGRNRRLSEGQPAPTEGLAAVDDDDIDDAAATRPLKALVERAEEVVSGGGTLPAAALLKGEEFVQRAGELQGAFKNMLDTLADDGDGDALLAEKMASGTKFAELMKEVQSEIKRSFGGFGDLGGLREALSVVGPPGGPTSAPDLTAEQKEAAKERFAGRLEKAGGRRKEDGDEERRLMYHGTGATSEIRGPHFPGQDKMVDRGTDVDNRTHPAEHTHQYDGTRGSRPPHRGGMYADLDRTYPADYTPDYDGTRGCDRPRRGGEGPMGGRPAGPGGEGGRPGGAGRLEGGFGGRRDTDSESALERGRELLGDLVGPLAGREPRQAGTGLLPRGGPLSADREKREGGFMSGEREGMLSDRRGRELLSQFAGEDGSRQGRTGREGSGPLNREGSDRTGARFEGGILANRGLLGDFAGGDGGRQGLGGLMDRDSDDKTRMAGWDRDGDDKTRMAGGLMNRDGDDKTRMAGWDRDGDDKTRMAGGLMNRDGDDKTRMAGWDGEGAERSWNKAGGERNSQPPPTRRRLENEESAEADGDRTTGEANGGLGALLGRDREGTRPSRLSGGVLDDLPTLGVAVPTIDMDLPTGRPGIALPTRNPGGGLFGGRGIRGDETTRMVTDAVETESKGRRGGSLLDREDSPTRKPGSGFGGAFGGLGNADGTPATSSEGETVLGAMTSEGPRGGIGGVVGGASAGLRDIEFPTRLFKRTDVPVEAVALEYIDRNGGPSVEVLSWLEDKKLSDFLNSSDPEMLDRFEMAKELLHRLLELLCEVLPSWECGPTAEPPAYSTDYTTGAYSSWAATVATEPTTPAGTEAFVNDSSSEVAGPPGPAPLP